MSKKRKALKPEAPLAVDPDAPVFQVTEVVEVKRPNLWSGYRGVVESITGGLCRVVLNGKVGQFTFHADIPARELKLIL